MFKDNLKYANCNWMIREANLYRESVKNSMLKDVVGLIQRLDIKIYLLRLDLNEICAIYKELNLKADFSSVCHVGS